MDEVAAHVIRRRLSEVVITPEHVKRAESPAFRAAKKRLREDGHYRCWICGGTDQLQVHHYGCEWSLWPNCDPETLKAFCEEWDPYGYGRLLRSKPITDPGDVRNLLVLCQAHHIGVDHADGGSGTGVHELTFPLWVIQKLAKPGEDPVPQKGEAAP